MLFLFSDIGHDDAPTRVRVGSHVEIARLLAPAGEGGMTLRELAANGFDETSRCGEALVTGSAGTVYLCHPFLWTAPRRIRPPSSAPSFARSLADVVATNSASFSKFEIGGQGLHAAR